MGKVNLIKRRFKIELWINKSNMRQLNDRISNIRISITMARFDHLYRESMQRNIKCVRLK